MEGTVTRNKWMATVASIWIQCTTGSLYTFSIYSPVLKSTQSYDQSTLDTISAFKDFGANVGILSGLLYSAVVSLPSPRGRPSGSAAANSISGPWVVLLAGAIQCFAGYLLMWLAVTGLIPRPPVAVMCVFMLLAAHGANFLNTGNVVTAVPNFPDYSGTIVGIMKGFLGLSGAILIQVYQTIFNNKPTSFLLTLALFPTFNTLLFMSCVRILVTNEVDEKKHLDVFSAISVIIAAYLMVVIIVKNNSAVQLPVHVAISVVLIVLLASPLYIAVKERSRDSLWTTSTPLIEENRTRDGPNQFDAGSAHVRQDATEYDQVHDDATEALVMYDEKIVQWEEDLNLLQAMCTANFWFLFLTTACGMGSGLATVNNISQIGGSLGYRDVETSTLVSLWSIWNFLGRFGAGNVSDYFLHIKGWARPFFLAITLATMSIGHLVIASGLPGALYAGSVLVGVCYGSQWSLMPTIASEIFGVVHFGTIFNTITIAGPFGSYILSVKVVGYIYDKEASPASIESKCMGAHCFRLSFFIMAATTFLGSLIALGLFYRTRTLYRQVVIRKLHLGRNKKSWS